MLLDRETFCNFYFNICKWNNLETTLFKSAFHFTILNKTFSLKSKFLLVVRNGILHLRERKLNYCETLFDINIVVVPASISFMKTNRLLLKETMEGRIIAQNKPKTTYKI